MTNEIEKDVAELVRQAAQDEEAVDDYEMDLFEKDILDSIGIMEMIDLIEEKYHIELLPEEIIPENFINITSIGRMIERYLN